MQPALELREATPIQKEFVFHCANVVHVLVTKM